MKKMTTLLLGFFLLAGQASASGYDNKDPSFGDGMSVLTFFSSVYISGPTSISTAGLYDKQEIEQVSVDAYNFLAGEEMTLALEHQMNAIRKKLPEAQDMSDEEVAVLMLEILQ